MAPAGCRAALVVVLVAALALVGRPARALWRTDAAVTLNSAYNLPAGDFVIGLLTPLQIGISDDVMVSLHPVLELLLTPNVGLRIALLRRPFALAATVAYAQTFLSEHDGGFPGTAQGGLAASWRLAPGWVLTATAGYGLDFTTVLERVDVEQVRTASGELLMATRRRRNTVETALVAHGPTYGVGLNWRPSERHLVMLQVQAFVDAMHGVHETPYAALVYAHAWEQMRVAVGVAAGRFPIRTGSGDLVALPVYPIADVWMRF